MYILPLITIEGNFITQFDLHFFRILIDTDSVHGFCLFRMKTPAIRLKKYIEILK